MDEDKIILDRKSFEALAVDSRVKILKSLKQRRKTLSELAQEQKMSVSGVKEHLETLEKVGLIEKKDDGHKWKYYDLTKKGSDIIGPREIRVWILLATSILALLASFTAIATYDQPEVMTSAPAMMKNIDQPEQQFEVMVAAFDNTSDRLASNGGPTAGSLDHESAVEDKEKETADLSIPILVAIVSFITMLGCVFVLLINRSKYSFHQ
ncbi:Bacterial regulatory protein, arsR family [Candidatus Bilamarchaeum dharawalense]|uniref:Bacterial regulatory protein, arsR family n=1 Tax=Candidatus Bilamarchaeum dharawalense TaxID=2885759 RepID=A0A5E4LNW1_9ARCH|nr:Bacterial regulatory protein, arsR family [Candidatus Bilamarchaeum dharawalense]